ncbi:MAG: DUF523 and DUF1722 domain-containing protein [Candidatus Bipolaricaulota bacterium]
MEDRARPQIVVSKCLGFAHCRYNGLTIRSDAVDAMVPHVSFVPVCPEVEVGLGVPRDPVRIIRQDGVDRLVQPATGCDVTEDMHRFAETFLGGLAGVDGFVLKNRSPSCGISDVKVYSRTDKAPAIGRTAGLFGREVLGRFSELTVEDEGRLTNFRLREHFLTKVFALATFRQVVASGEMSELVGFQARNKLLLMSYSQASLKELGRIVANPRQRNWEELCTAYRAQLVNALARPPRRPSAINVAQHAFGYVSKQLTKGEKSYFLDTLGRYREGKAPLSVVTGVLGAWVTRFDVEYLAQQTFFAPYPEGLVEISDSGKGREL